MTTDTPDYAVLRKDENGMDWFDHRYKHSRHAERYAEMERRQFIAEQERAAEARRCIPGQQCQDINRLCSKHSMEYQLSYGRASNE